MHQIEGIHTNRNFDIAHFHALPCPVRELLEGLQAAVRWIYGNNLRVDNKRLQLRLLLENAFNKVNDVGILVFADKIVAPRLRECTAHLSGHIF